MRYEQIICYEVLARRPQAPIESDPFHRYVLEDGSDWTAFYRTNNGYLLRFPDLADFLVSADGKDVTAFPSEETDISTLEHLYINQLVPLALSRQGLPAFHASVVTVPGGAIAFLGRSGTGKSTLAASFALEGSAFLTDDGLLLEETENGYMALPSHASLRLWDDSVEALVDYELEHAGPVSYSDKSRLLAGEALSYCNEARPLLAAFLLDSTKAESFLISDLDGSNRYRAWLENSFLLDIEDQALLAEHFDWTHRISSTVPTYKLDYPRDFCMLPEVRRCIGAEVAQV